MENLYSLSLSLFVNLRIWIAAVCGRVWDDPPWILGFWSFLKDDEVEKTNVIS